MKTKAKRNKNHYTPEWIKETIDNYVRPPHIRKGQFVFNIIESYFGNVVREVQFIDGVDCFYDDTQIDNFIEKVCIRLNNKHNVYS